MLSFCEVNCINRIIRTLLLIILFIPVFTFANGDPNIDGGGGGTDDGDVTGGSYWNVGDDGVRVSIVDDEGEVYRTVNFTNRAMTVDLHFGLNSKLDYRNGTPLTATVGSEYKDVNPTNPIPQIISSSGAINIAAVKQYFGQEGTLKDIAEKTSFPYDRLIDGEFILLLEPIIYTKFEGNMFAMTATEAALYDQAYDGKLKSKLGYATHQNLPLSMFLERPDLGYPAWGGATTGVRSNNEIISSLGLGTVRFRDAPPQPPQSDTQVEYRTDTDVITAITVSNNSGDDINPNDNAYVVFNIGGNVIRKPFVTPPNEDTLVWVRWHTPSSPQIVTVAVSSTHGSVSDSSINCNVVELIENTPPDPRSTDNPPSGFRIPPTPWGAGKGNTSLSWGEWLPWWKENWKWVPDWYWSSSNHTASCEDDCTDDHGDWVDRGQWKDLGNWEYDWESYSASLSVTTKIVPAKEVQTATKNSMAIWEMKSGYGVELDVQSRVSTSGKSGDITMAQNTISQFPEFNYSNYFRVLQRSNTGLRSSFTFAYNKYSFMGASVHYTPLWFPDRSRYEPKVTVFDVWTPAGQLYYTNSDYLTINGDCYDDWNIAPFKE